MKARVDPDCNNDSCIIYQHHIKQPTLQNNCYYCDDNPDAQRQRHPQRLYISTIQGTTIQNMDNDLDGRTGTARPARPTAAAKAHAAPAKIAITRSRHVNHADHLGTDHPTNVRHSVAITTRDQRTTHASCTHNDDVVDGSHDAASGHTYNYNKTTNKKNDQPRRQLSAWQHQHATVH